MQPHTPKGKRSELPIPRNRHWQSSQLASGPCRARNCSLSPATGLPEQEIEPIPDSIPLLPDEAAPNAAEETSNNDLRVKIAVEQAHASDLRAQGEHKLRWPSVDLVGQYALLSRFNNYDQFYKRFERNNGTVGAVVRFGFLNFAQTARARQADADDAKPHRQVDAVKSQVSGEALRLRTIVKQLTAARDTAQLEYVLARADTTRLDMKAEIGKTALGDQMTGHIAEDDKFGALLDATFELQKAQLQMLNATDDLGKWVLAQVAAPAGQTTISATMSRVVASVGVTEIRSIRSLMMAPAVTVLPVRRSQQFVA